ncbi:MAG: Uma2 family endonuclease [Oculatellaceae cyanobacterium Prado106]|jgi:Uma2 family endonuclease|nr:Uma2 family endonuclease [Oculatellaceae cyanobacterium Prado106]
MATLTEALTIDISRLGLTDAQFYALCHSNEALRFELTAQGALIVMSPVGGESGNRESRLNAQVWNWNEATQLGQVFSSSTVFQLPNGAKRSPDVAWVSQPRWLSLTPEQRKRFPPIAPDFVIELRSETDDLSTLQAKMQEYLDNGVQLGWLLNPQDQQVEIYQAGAEVRVLALPVQLSGEDVLPSFVLNVDRF